MAQEVCGGRKELLNGRCKMTTVRGSPENRQHYEIDTVHDPADVLNQGSIDNMGEESWESTHKPF